MADFPAPVAAQIQPPDPTKGLSQLSSVLGVQQQRQNLQTGAITQQTAQAVQKQQQLAAEKQQGVQNFFKNWDPSAHLGADGTTDLNSVLQDPQLKASGNAMPDIVQSLLDIKNKQLGVKQQLSTLNGDQVKQFSTVMGSLAKDPDVVADKTDPTTGVNAGRAKVNEALSNFSQLSPDSARIGQIYGQGVQHAPPGKLSNVIQAYQLQGQSASEQQAQQNPQVTPIGTGAATDIYNVNKATGVQPGQKPVAAIPNAPPPGFSVVVDPRTQNPYLLNAQTGEARDLGHGYPGKTPATPAASTTAPGAAPSATAATTPSSIPAPYKPGQAQLTPELTKALGDRVSQAQAAANNTTQAQDALTRARTLLDDPNGPNAGTGFENKKAIMNFLSSAGIDTKGADDANTLMKNLARYEASRATQAGLGGTDAARELAHNGSPTVALDNKALKGVVTQSLATEKALAAYAGTQSKTQDPAALAKNETDFRNIPNLIQGYEYGLARNPKEADEFLTKHGISREDMGKTRQMIKEFEARGQAQ
jgi:hypothetical protein